MNNETQENVDNPGSQIHVVHAYLFRFAVLFQLTTLDNCHSTWTFGLIVMDGVIFLSRFTLRPSTYLDNVFVSLRVSLGDQTGLDLNAVHAFN